MLLEGWRRMAPGAKAALMDAWSHDVRALAMAGVDRRHPDASPRERLIELGRVLYGDDIIDAPVVAALDRHLAR